jgi:hypothetical protein
MKNNSAISNIGATIFSIILAFVWLIIGVIAFVTTPITSYLIFGKMCGVIIIGIIGIVYGVIRIVYGYYKYKKTGQYNTKNIDIIFGGIFICGCLCLFCSLLPDIIK